MRCETEYTEIDELETKGTQNELQPKVAIRFAIRGDLRFISHHDTMRLFARALARSRLPLKYSEGFNPHLRMSLPLPRSVGMASDADLLVIDLQETMDPDDVRDRLAREMPDGLSLIDAWSVREKRAIQPETATYTVPLDEDQADIVRERLNRLCSPDDWTIERDLDGRKKKIIDVKACMVDARVTENSLAWTQHLSPTGTLRISEWLEALGLDAATMNHLVVRREVRWSSDRELKE